MLTGLTRTPEAQAQIQAAEALEQIQSASRHSSTEHIKLMFSEETTVELPPKAFELLVKVLGQLANGNGVTIMPSHAMLTTQQAADILSVSRPYLVNLLERGEIPFERVGRHRRIKAEELRRYQTADEHKRREAADELAQLIHSMEQ